MNQLVNSSKQIFHKFSDYMEKNTKGTEIGIYTVSGVLFAVAYYKIRPITKFGKPSDIPKKFFKVKCIQNGKIISIEANQTAGTLLRVSHQPPVNLFFLSRKTLPVKISGVEINANGFSWLQSVAVDKKITFLPLHNNANNVECKVSLLNLTTKKPALDLGECLINLGFGKVLPINREVLQSSELDKEFIQYLTKLRKAEKRARRKRLGMWTYNVPDFPWQTLYKIQSKISQLTLAYLPAKFRLPDLVR